MPRLITLALIIVGVGGRRFRLRAPDLQKPANCGARLPAPIKSGSQLHYKIDAVTRCMNEVLGKPAPGLGVSFKEAIARLGAAGCSTYPHGGVVRDCMLGILAKDVDVGFDCTMAKVKEIAKAQRWNVAKESKKLIVLGSDDEVGADGVEALEGVSHAWFIGRKANDREFTVNDLAFDVASGTIIDTSSGVADLCDAQGPKIAIAAGHDFDAWRKTGNGRKLLRFFKLRAKGFKAEAKLITQVLGAYPKQYSWHHKIARANAANFFCSSMIDGRIVFKLGSLFTYCEVACPKGTVAAKDAKLKDWYDAFQRDVEGTPSVRGQWITATIQGLASYHCARKPYRVLVVLGGGFKPAHRGHYEMLRKAMKEKYDHYRDKVQGGAVSIGAVVFITGRERDGYTQADGASLWSDHYLKQLKLDLQADGIPAAAFQFEGRAMPFFAAPARRNKLFSIRGLASDTGYDKIILASGDDRAGGGKKLAAALYLSAAGWTKGGATRIQNYAVPRGDGSDVAAMLSATQFRILLKLAQDQAGNGAMVDKLHGHLRTFLPAGLSQGEAANTIDSLKGKSTKNIAAPPTLKPALIDCVMKQPPGKQFIGCLKKAIKGDDARDDDAENLDVEQTDLVTADSSAEPELPKSNLSQDFAAIAISSQENHDEDGAEAAPYQDPGEVYQDNGVPAQPPR